MDTNHIQKLVQMIGEVKRFISNTTFIKNILLRC